MLDVTLLRVMRRRSDFNKLNDLIQASALDEVTKAILADFGKYYDKFPTHDGIDIDLFVPRFLAWHPTLKQDRINEFKKIFENCKPDADEDQRTNIMQEMADLELMTRLANIAEEYHAGELEDSYSAVTQAFDRFKSRLGIKNSAYIDIPIGELLQDEFDDSGVEWRLECLNKSMRKLRPGDFGIVAGRPDKGKTTFISSEVTGFAPQLPTDRNIIWLNNEGPGKRIIPRLYQSALDVSMTDLKQLQQQGVLVDMYRDAIGGRLNKIRIVDVHGFATGQIEAILEDNNPGVIVYDMIDNIRGFGDAARTDLMLEEMYKWAREISVKYDCIGIGTSQISNDGDGLQFPTLGMLKDSKTGKQGACDFQLMIGASNDPGLMGSRYLSLPKNKLRRPDGPSDPRAEVIFDGIRARYRDIPIGS